MILKEELLIRFFGATKGKFMWKSSSRSKNKQIRVLHFWGGVPLGMNSRWKEMLRTIKECTKRGWESSVVWSEMPKVDNLVSPFLQAGAKILIHERTSSAP